MERSGARKTPRNQLTNKDLNAEVALDVKGNASKLVVQSFLNIFIDKYWAGDVADHAGGGAAACCYPGLKDWSQPVTVTWTWGTEEDPKTKAITKRREQRTMVARFPASGPHSDHDPMKDDAYVCVILRDLDKAELAFSPTASGCADQ